METLITQQIPKGGDGCLYRRIFIIRPKIALALETGQLSNSFTDKRFITRVSSRKQ
jgi:hypothetical protein